MPFVKMVKEGVAELKEELKLIEKRDLEKREFEQLRDSLSHLKREVEKLELKRRKEQPLSHFTKDKKTVSRAEHAYVDAEDQEFIMRKMVIRRKEVSSSFAHWMFNNYEV